MCIILLYAYTDHIDSMDEEVAAAAGKRIDNENKSQTKFLFFFHNKYIICLFFFKFNLFLANEHKNVNFVCGYGTEIRLIYVHA